MHANSIKQEVNTAACGKLLTSIANSINGHQLVSKFPNNTDVLIIRNALFSHAWGQRLALNIN